MAIDITKQGLERDTALRLAGSASALPDGVTPIAGVDESALAYRMARVSGEGGLSIIPASDWGAGIGEPLFVFKAGYTSSDVFLASVDGSKYPAIFLAASVIGLTNQPFAPRIYVESVTQIGVTSLLYMLPISINGVVTNYYLPIPPAINNLRFDPGTGSAVNSVSICAYSIRPGVYLPRITNEIVVYSQRTIAPPQSVSSPYFRLPSPVSGSAVIEYVSGSFSGFVTLTIMDIPTNQIIATSPGLYEAVTGAPQGLIFQNMNNFIINAHFPTGSGSVTINMKGTITS